MPTNVSPLAKRYEREIELLFWRGYFPQYGSKRQAMTLVDRPTLDQAMREFELLHSKPAVVEELEYRFCALPDIAPLRASLCKWPQPDKVTWHTQGALSGSISAQDFRDAYEIAFSWWMEVCGVVLVYSSNPKTANIIAFAKHMGGPGDVLADSQLPCGMRKNSDRQIPERYDSEAWVISEKPRSMEIDLVRVICHEGGHGLGSDHIENGNLLAPMYSTRIRKPQPGDIAEMQKRYGPPKDVPPVPVEPLPPVTPPPGEDPATHELTIESFMSGGKARLRVRGHRLIKTSS